MCKDPKSTNLRNSKSWICSYERYFCATRASSKVKIPRATTDFVRRVKLSATRVGQHCQLERHHQDMGRFEASKKLHLYLEHDDFIACCKL